MQCLQISEVSHHTFLLYQASRRIMRIAQVDMSRMFWDLGICMVAGIGCH